MTIIDASGFEQVLDSIELRGGAGRRLRLTRDRPLPLPSHTVTLVYVIDGEVRTPPLPLSCVFDVNTVTVSTGETQAHLVRGDAFLSLGRRQLVLDSETDATLMVAELELSDATTWLGSLPDSISVNAFASLEPAAAALASSMGLHGADELHLRSGDPVICRLMTKTVLLSLLRAWFDLGCAPQDWPAKVSDPFLDRVIEAIHRDPGRDWTLEALASEGAMSRSAFAQRFRSLLGSPPASYVTGVRMDSAKRMLAAGHSISRTSRELGYASDEGFSRAFRRHTGMTPSTWRSRRGEVQLALVAS